MSTLNNRLDPTDLLRAEGANGSITVSGPSVENEPPNRHSPIRLLRLAQVMEMTGLRKTKIYELHAEGAFPRRVKITAHSVGWVEAEVQAWLAQRIESSTHGPATSWRGTART
ncbi:MAG TPA: AlpA family transcriptional regulator [Steroidobacteraceae bacterium]|nr:AlpA family transcriptional regulator [Steroidobacteraceae bacterium]